MPKPWKNPRSKIFWFRKRVPEKLRPIVGATEIRRSLSTNDFVIAQALSDAMHAEHDERWARILEGMTSLDHLSTEALAGEFYDAIIRQYQREPGSAKEWKMRHIWARLDANYIPRQYRPKYIATFPNLRLKKDVRTFLVKKGLVLDPESHHRFYVAAARVSVDAADRMRRIAEFDFSGDAIPPIDPNVARFPTEDHRRIASSRFDHLFVRFADEARYPEKTRESWKARVARFMAFCGKKFPADVDRADAKHFKNHLLARGLDPVATIRNGYFAANRAFMTWCIANNLGPDADPFRGIKIYGDRNKPKLRRAKGYNDEEAAAILAASLRPMPPRTTLIAAAARRWIPWICATTGARVTEVAQLRRQDVLLSTWSRRHRVRIPYIRFTLEAGPQKVFERDVPVHPDLLALGFMEFVQDAPRERLFVDPERARTRGDVAGLTASAGQGVARWARTLVDPDRKIQPNHAWRHRFNDLCRDARVHPEDRDFISGHVPANIGAKYGDVHPAALLPWMCSLDSHLSLVVELYPDLAQLYPAALTSTAFRSLDDEAEHLRVVRLSGTQDVRDGDDF